VLSSRLQTKLCKGVAMSRQFIIADIAGQNLAQPRRSIRIRGPSSAAGGK
jgi:hypothetical protein